MSDGMFRKLLETVRKVDINEDARLSSDFLRRIKGLVYQPDLRAFQDAVNAIVNDLEKEGFDVEDILSWLISQIQQYRGRDKVQGEEEYYTQINNAEAEMDKELNSPEATESKKVKEGRIRLKDIQSYKQVGYLTRDTGFVLELDNGQKFAITVQEDRRNGRGGDVTEEEMMNMMTEWMEVGFSDKDDEYDEDEGEEMGRI